MMDAVFEPTLTMITQNFEDFPEHRLNFFKFLRAANNFCFEALFSIPPEHQKLVVDSIVWAFKHTERNVAETGLEILLELFEHMSKHSDVAQGFYQAYLLPLVQDILAVMTDRLHKSCFGLHVQVLRHLFHLVQSGMVVAPLFERATHPNYNNAQFVREYVGGLLLESFPTLNQTQVVQFLDTVFDVRLTMDAFKERVRDFLIQLKEFSAEDNSLLWSEEQSQTQQVTYSAATLFPSSLLCSYSSCCFCVLFSLRINHSFSSDSSNSTEQACPACCSPQRWRTTTSFE
jgi:exportin-1